MKLIRELDKSIQNINKDDLTLLSEHCSAVEQAGFKVVLKENSSNIYLKKDIKGNNIQLDFMPHPVSELDDEKIKKIENPIIKEKILLLKQKGKSVFLHPFKFWIYGDTHTQVYLCINMFGDFMIATSFILDNQELKDHGEIVLNKKFRPKLHVINKKFTQETLKDNFIQLGVTRKILENVAKISEYRYKTLESKWLKNIKDFINT
jgi:hypothetical protein